MKFNLFSKAGLVALASVLALTGQPISADAAISEMVVSARKRDENMQSVPIAITAFSGALIEKAQISSMEDIANLTPGLIFQDFGSGALKTPTIRGLAQTNVAGQDGNVGVFLDGFFLPSRNSMDVGIVDLERIEVVKGPQNALYGRNTFGGAINYVSREPGDDIEGYISGSVGTDEYYEVKASVGGPIVEDKLKGRISLGYKEFDGTFENMAGGDNLQGEETFDVLGNLILTPTEDLSIKLMGYYGDHDFESNAVFNIAGNCPTGINAYYCGTLPTQDPVDLNVDAPGYENEFTLLGLTIDWDIGDYTLTSLTSYSKSEDLSVTDYDATSSGIPYFSSDFSTTIDLNNYLAFEQEVDSYSQEIRLQSPEEDRFSWMVGGYYYKAEFENASYSIIDTTPAISAGVTVGGLCAFGMTCRPGGVSAIFDAPATADNSETEIWAFYAQGAFDFTDRLSGTAELRYTHEEKDSTPTVAFAFTPIANPMTTQGSWNFLAPRFTLDYAVSDDVIVYGSAALGVKSGGFNGSFSPLFPGEAAYDEESNWTYELGVKSTLLEDRLRANVALFYVDWEDMQIPSQSQDPLFLQSLVRNTGEATSKGIEIELDFSVTDNITVGGTYAYADPEFGEATDLGLTSVCVAGLCDLNVKGQQIGRTVENTFSAYLDIVEPLANGLEIFGRLDYTYQDELPVRAANLQFVDSRSLFNARIGVSSDNWEASLWAKNLFDEDYVTSQIRQPRLNDFSRPTTVIQGDGRVVGVNAKYKF